MGAGQESRGWAPTWGGCLCPSQPYRPQGREKSQASSVESPSREHGAPSKAPTHPGETQALVSSSHFSRNILAGFP